MSLGGRGSRHHTTPPPCPLLRIFFPLTLALRQNRNNSAISHGRLLINKLIDLENVSSPLDTIQGLSKGITMLRCAQLGVVPATWRMFFIVTMTARGISDILWVLQAYLFTC